MFSPFFFFFFFLFFFVSHLPTFLFLFGSPPPPSLFLSLSRSKTTENTLPKNKTGLPPQHQLPGLHLPRHPQGAVVARAHPLQGPPLDLLAALRPQPGRPARPGDRPHLQDGQGAVRGDRPRVDAQVRDGIDGWRWRGRGREGGGRERGERGWERKRGANTEARGSFQKFPLSLLPLLFFCVSLFLPERRRRRAECICCPETLPPPPPPEKRASERERKKNLK